MNWTIPVVAINTVSCLILANELRRWLLRRRWQSEMITLRQEEQAVEEQLQRIADEDARLLREQHDRHVQRERERLGGHIPQFEIQCYSANTMANIMRVSRLQSYQGHIFVVPDDADDSSLVEGVDIYTGEEALQIPAGHTPEPIAKFGIQRKTALGWITMHGHDDYDSTSRAVRKLKLKEVQQPGAEYRVVDLKYKVVVWPLWMEGEWA